jgi:hypothetical protein
MGTLLDLANRMKSTRERLSAIGSDKAVLAANAIVRDLVTVTPVDTSQALSNWQVAIGSPVGNRIDAYFIGVHGSTQELSGASALAKARSILETKKPGQTIYISNVLPYIQRLNQGYSAQAPAGFVERAIIIGRGAIK